jgi:glycosyltransferase involved in cell wall biosynthesis
MVYSAADVYVIPSLQDNLPSTVLESMACGTPVVGFDVGGIREMVRPGVTGVLATPGDPKALASAIECIAFDSHGRHKLAEQCRETALAEYGMKMYVRRYEELYHGLVEPAADRVAAASPASARVEV